eukprot:2563599-Rhodomonas_salina.1
MTLNPSQKGTKPYALQPMPYTLCTTPYALHPMPYALARLGRKPFRYRVCGTELEYVWYRARLTGMMLLYPMADAYRDGMMLLYHSTAEAYACTRGPLWWYCRTLEYLYHDMADAYGAT